MRISNYKQGYIERFDCVIDGTIYLQGKAELYTLYDTVKKMPDCIWKDNALKTLKTVKGKVGEVFHLTTTPTEFIAKKLRLKNYKLGNYQFIIEKMKKEYKTVCEYKVVITEQPFVYYIKATGKAEAEELAQMEHFDARIGELYSIKVKKMK